MATLPINRTRLNAAIANQQPSIIAASQANREAHIEAADTLDLLYQYVTAIQAEPNGVYAVDAGTTDDYVVTLAPVPSAYFAGMVVRFKANTVNTGAATLNVNALGAKTIKKNAVDDLGDNDIVAGQIVEVMYDGTNFQLMGASRKIPSCRVYHSLTQSIPNNAFTTLQFNSETYDNDTMHDVTTNTSRITFKTSGKYIIKATIGFAPNITGVRVARLLLNGATILDVDYMNGINDLNILKIMEQYSFSVNDYVEITVYQNSGGALDIAFSSQYNPVFSAVRVG